MIYAARFEAMNGLLAFLTENCCQGAAEACAPAVCKPGRANASKQVKAAAMKRLHVHVAVDDLDQSIGFYSALFAAKPSV